MKYCQDGVGTQFIVDDLNLSLLCIKCMEVSILFIDTNLAVYVIQSLQSQDNLYKEYSQQPSLLERLQFASDSLEKSLEVLGNNARLKELSEKMEVEYMEAIANVRFGLCTAAEYFFEYYWKKDQYMSLSQAEKGQLNTLTLRVKDVCQKRCVKIEPRHFLAKQLVRQFGFPCLYKLSQHSSFKTWIIPVSRLENQVLRNMEIR